MKNYVLLFCFSICTFSIYSQYQLPRVPYNILHGGVVDIVVINDDIPVREVIPVDNFG